MDTATQLLDNMVEEIGKNGAVQVVINYVYNCIKMNNNQLLLSKNVVI